MGSRRRCCAVRHFARQCRRTQAGTMKQYQAVKQGAGQPSHLGQCSVDGDAADVGDNDWGDVDAADGEDADGQLDAGSS